MLTELLIRNLAIIDQIHVPLQAGLNVLTGETGAGKSIIIHALDFLVGDRGDPDLIRTGADTLLVEAVFDARSCPAARSVLEELGIDPEDGTLILSRELSRAGRSRCRINGRAATVAMLKRLGRSLVDIHGQHEHQSLVDPATHVRFLDAFGSERIAAPASRYVELYRRLTEIDRELDELRQVERERIQREDLLNFQAEEIDQAGLHEGEEEQLSQERHLLANAERIREQLERACRSLTGEGGAADALIDALKALRDLETLNPDLRRRHGELSQALEVIQDAGFALERFIGQVEADPERLAQVESRLDLIRWLKRKYGESVEAILAHRQRIGEELQRLTSSGERIEQLQKERDAVWTDVQQAGAALSEVRREFAKRLERCVQQHLKALVMDKARFKVAVEPAECGPGGFDRVEFLIATNAGEPLKALAKIASGGEMSRTMLALKASLQSAHEIPVLAFDEVDVGIGGRAAEAVGEKLRQVARYAQVLCITHQAQIACQADWHLRVDKVEQQKRTRVVVTPLGGEERIRELARMLSGKEIMETSLRHARELLQRAAATGR